MKRICPYVHEKLAHIEILLNDNQQGLFVTGHPIIFHLPKNQSQKATWRGSSPVLKYPPGPVLSLTVWNVGSLPSNPLCLLGLSVNTHFLFRDVGHCRERGQVSVYSWCHLNKKQTLSPLADFFADLQSVWCDCQYCNQLRITGSSRVPGNRNVLSLPESILQEKKLQPKLWFFDLALFN